MEYKIIKPKIEDLDKIFEILLQWTEKEEAEKYVKRIKNEINGTTEFNMSFWVIKKDEEVIGVSCLSDILPSIKSFAKTENPCELKILYLDNKFRGQGFGKILINFLEEKVKENKYTELMVRSAKKYKDTAYGFYEKMGYKNLGLTDNNMAVFNKEL
jgi:GNAT superfamily N-acetyltransferase